MEFSQRETGNILLSTMLQDDFALLENSFDRIQLPARHQLHRAGHRIDHVYFPEDGVISIVALGFDGRHCEVGFFGREGLSEIATVMGADYSPYEAYVHTVGVSAQKLPAKVLTLAMTSSATLRLHLLKYAQAMTIQLSSSIVAASEQIDQRLARWLLMFHDRIAGDSIALTHEFIAIMLNIRRAGVTVAINAMRRKNLIFAGRGRIEIIDRAGLERLAGGCYGLAEAEYERLVGVALRRHPTEPHGAVIQGGSAAS